MKCVFCHQEIPASVTAEQTAQQEKKSVLREEALKEWAGRCPKDYTWIPFFISVVVGFAFGVEANYIHPEQVTTTALVLIYTTLSALLVFFLQGIWYNPRQEDLAKKKMLTDKPELYEVLWGDDDAF